MIEEVKIRISNSDLLARLWYSDGSGAQGFSFGVEGPSSDYELVGVQVYKDYSNITIRRKDEAQRGGNDGK